MSREIYEKEDPAAWRGSIEREALKALRGAVLVSAASLAAPAQCESHPVICKNLKHKSL